MTESRDSGDVEVRYFLGPEMVAVRFETAAPLAGEGVTLDGREYCVAYRAVRISEATDEFEAFGGQVRPATDSTQPRIEC